MAARVTHSINTSGVAATLGAPGIQRDMLRRGIRVQTQVRILSTVDTGRLRSSWAVRQEPRGQSVATIVGSDVEYALFVILGTSPHVIRPRNARVLRWTDGGRPVYARHVNHPGTAAQPVLQIALAAAAG